jgi:hypothetical protein
LLAELRLWRCRRRGAGDCRRHYRGHGEGGHGSADYRGFDTTVGA